MSLFHVTAAAFGARSIIFYLRSTVAQRAAGSFPVFRLLRRSPGTRLFHRGHILTQIPKMTLLCWGAVNVSCYVATCQEAVIHRAAPTTERKPVAKVQVHKLVFVLRLSLRALVLLLKFVPLLLLSPLTWVSPGFASRWLGVLLWVTETSGPTFIKLGQWASTRRDIFSQEFCDRFSRLHVKVRPHSWAHTKQCLRRAFGDGWRRLFVFEDEEPVGSGCVAQVYRGWARVGGVQDPGFQTLVEDMERGEHLLEAWEIPGLWGMVSSLWGLWRRKKGEEWADAPGSRHGGSHPDVEHLIPVAIKVLHPGIKSQVEIDLLLMRAASWLLHRLPGLKWLSLPEIVEEFERLMTKQIDLRFEARNIERFKENFRDVDYVKFPTPLRPFVTRTILVETFEESEPISKYLGSDVPQEVKQRIARMGVQTMLKMVFVDNFVHGDLHPGNILVQRRGAGDQGGDSAAAGSGGGGEARQDKATLTDLWDTVMVSMRPASEPLQLVLLDAGIVAQLEPRDRDNFRAVFTAVVLRQGERVAELILHHARANECEDVPGFKREMAALVDEALSTTLSLGKVQVADLLSRVFGLLITHKVKLESNFASMVIAIMVLEGLGRSLDPNLDILEMAKPLLLKNCASLL